MRKSGSLWSSWNGDYQNFVKLANPINDAENLRDAAISVNFDVVLRRFR